MNTVMIVTSTVTAPTRTGLATREAAPLRFLMAPAGSRVAGSRSPTAPGAGAGGDRARRLRHAPAVGEVRRGDARQVRADPLAAVLELLAVGVFLVVELGALVDVQSRAQQVADLVVAVDAEALPEEVVPDRLEPGERVAAVDGGGIRARGAAAGGARVVLEATPAVVHRLEELAEGLEGRLRERAY